MIYKKEHRAAYVRLTSMHSADEPEDKMKKHIQSEHTVWFQRRKKTSITNFFCPASSSVDDNNNQFNNVLISEKQEK